MTATYTEGSSAALDKVRRALPDKTLTGLTPVAGVYTLTSYVFSNEEIADYLADADADPYAAAAAMLEAVLIGGASTAAKVAGLGYAYDPTAGYGELRRRITWLRSQSAAGSVLVASSQNVTNTAVW